MSAIQITIVLIVDVAIFHTSSESVGVICRLALYHVIVLVDITVDGQQLFGDVLIVVILRSEEDVLRFLGLVDELIPRIAGLIIDAGEPQDLHDESRDLRFELVRFQVKRHVTGLDGRGCLVARRNRRRVNDSLVFNKDLCALFPG